MQPILNAARLVLRPFDLGDAAAVRQLAGDRLVADTTMNMPHPYQDGMAEAWIETHEPDYGKGSVATFAIARQSDSNLVGAISLKIDRPQHKAELGYWIGVPYWNRGYATEAAEAILRYGFADLKLNRIFAWHFARNPASGRVMAKVGMLKEGVARQSAFKDDRFEDLVTYGILREDWLKSRARTDDG